MDSERYTIRGITGVDVSLPIAGAGSRSYAFVIDWHIRVLLAFLWWLAFSITLFGTLHWTDRTQRSSTFYVFVVVVPLAIYFLYHPVVELAMRGQTPGKKMAGVRVVTTEGGTPGIGAILIRNVFRLIDCMPALYAVGLITTVVSAQRVRIGDMAAGTLLIVDESASHLDHDFGQPAVDDLAVLDLARQILERWPSLEVGKRGAIARALLRKTHADRDGTLDLLDDEALLGRITNLAGEGAS
jgi:uncharacterized RDD family membrane protein YckC